jgi:Na+-transporting NADH:ubiquinone oxidoreductase subunit NqrB
MLLSSPTSPSFSVLHWLKADARHFQILFQVIFLCYGIYMLHWEASPMKYFITFATVLLVQWCFNNYHREVFNYKSAFITGLSLCLMLKVNNPFTLCMAGSIAIASKFWLKANDKHFFNPANIGICLTMLFTDDAWISPGQWGSRALLFFLIGTAGFLVLFRIKRIDTALAFLITFLVLQYLRQIYFLRWEQDFFIHQLNSGTLLLFTFFMITDPVSSPRNNVARIMWAAAVAGLAFYLQTFKWINGAPIWALFFLSMTTPSIDYLFKGNKFNWK